MTETKPTHSVSVGSKQVVNLGNKESRDVFRNYSLSFDHEPTEAEVKKKIESMEYIELALTEMMAKSMNREIAKLTGEDELTVDTDNGDVPKNEKPKENPQTTDNKPASTPKQKNAGVMGGVKKFLYALWKSGDPAADNYKPGNEKIRAHIDSYCKEHSAASPWSLTGEQLYALEDQLEDANLIARGE